MRAMILAAGRGKRLGELTAELPKPLIEFAGKPMIHYALAAVAAAGIKECIINLCYKGELLAKYVGDGSQWGLKVSYSEEAAALLTGGGVKRALPWLSPTFLLVNSDLVHDVDLARLLRRGLPQGSLAHLVLVAASYATVGTQPKFALQQEQVLAGDDLVFSGISLIAQELFAGETRVKFRLVECLMNAMAQQRLTGEEHRGSWYDLGTPQSLVAAAADFN